MLFDTIRLITEGILINPSKLKDDEHFNYVDDDGMYRTKIKKRSGSILYVYRKPQQSLDIELSIPKFIYGNNVESLDKKGISIFWSKLQDRVIEDLGIKVEPDEWKIKRLDISYNFLVDDVSSYIRAIGNLNMIKRDKIIFNEDETILFKNKSSSVTFYDKEKECIYRKEDYESIDKASGILRLEVRPASYHIRDYSSTRKAVDFISAEYFSFIIKKFGINNFLGSINYSKVGRDGINLKTALEELSISDIEKVVGFSTFLGELGEKEVLDKKYYASGTYRNRQKLLKRYSSLTTNEKEKAKSIYVPIE